MPPNFSFFPSYPFHNRYYNYKTYSNKFENFQNIHNKSNNLENNFSKLNNLENITNKYNDLKNEQKKDSESSISSETSSEPFFEIFGLQLYLDDILIISILFFLYFEDVHDDALFICLILLLLN